MKTIPCEVQLDMVREQLRREREVYRINLAATENRLHVRTWGMILGWALAVALLVGLISNAEAGELDLYVRGDASYHLSGDHQCEPVMAQCDDWYGHAVVGVRWQPTDWLRFPLEVQHSSSLEDGVLFDGGRGEERVHIGIEVRVFELIP